MVISSSHSQAHKCPYFVSTSTFSASIPRRLQWEIVGGCNPPPSIAIPQPRFCIVASSGLCSCLHVVISSSALYHYHLGIEGPDILVAQVTCSSPHTVATSWRLALWRYLGYSK